MKHYVKMGIGGVVLSLIFFASTLILIFIYREHEVFTLPLQSVIFGALSSLSNAFLAFIAFWQLPQMEKTGRAGEVTARGQFLINLNEQWMQEDVVSARCYLHQLALTHRGPKMSMDISREIQDISEDQGMKNIRQFSQIISLLEFMETLGTLYRNDHISLVVIEQLFGGSIERYYHYLKEYMQHRRKYGSPAGVTFDSDAMLYKGFEELVMDLQRVSS
jgi:hypothetical protein